MYIGKLIKEGESRADNEFSLIDPALIAGRAAPHLPRVTTRVPLAGYAVACPLKEKVSGREQARLAAIDVIPINLLTCIIAPIILSFVVALGWILYVNADWLFHRCQN